ncbi:MAG TPA: phosphopantetheine-binding protein, partial [Thermoanaerobaculia bacterium]|nr:phosphopantetheine-binding protein [Thermoanaerobaculia bacterium]
VLALPGQEVGERRLVAYVVATVPEPPQPPPPTTEDLPAALRAYLAGRLPPHMLPAAWVVLDALPLTANGKVDRRALARRPPDAGPAAAAEFLPPRTPVEEILAAIWREVLGVERVGLRDDFFQLGGHSLSAARVLSRLRRELGVELPLGVLFESSTLESLAATVTAAQGTARESARESSILPGSPVGRLALPDSPLREGLALASELTDEQLDQLLGELMAEEEGR